MNSEIHKPNKPNLNWLAGLLSNPKTGQASHTKLWANICAGSMTYKFIMLSDTPEWLWWAYGAMVGGYALIKRGIATIPQLAEMSTNKPNKPNNDVADIE